MPELILRKRQNGSLDFIMTKYEVVEVTEGLLTPIVNLELPDIVNLADTLHDFLEQFDLECGIEDEDTEP